MKNGGLRVAIMALCLTAIVVSASAQVRDDPMEPWDPGHGEACRFDSNSYTREDVRAFRTAWDDLVARAKRSSDEWAGVYSEGADTSYRAIAWVPDEGYAYLFVSTCRAGFNDVDYGSVARSSSLVTFTTKRIGVTNHPRSLPWRMVPVRWGSWHLLVPETSFQEFCRYAVGRDLRESRYSFYFPSYYVRRTETDDVDWPTSGLVVPPEYERFVLQPLRAHVTSVGVPFSRGETDDYLETVTPVTIDLGWNDGVQVGNVLSVTGTGHSVFVTEVRKNESIGEVVVAPYDEPEPPVVRGAALVTDGPFADMPRE